ncbi:MAG: hypothetical protein M3256_28120 [Actinomycetota bacterium]|nr:hypothetical protein [Actinomycetota bacterium]
MFDVLHLSKDIDLSGMISAGFNERDNRFRHPSVDKHQISVNLVEGIVATAQRKRLFPPC